MRLFIENSQVPRIPRKRVDGMEAVSCVGGAAAQFPQQHASQQPPYMPSQVATQRPHAASATHESQQSNQAEIPPADRSYSLAQESYQEEITYERLRRQRKRLMSIARVILLVILIPVLLVALFLIAYAVACIAQGATPGELAELMEALFTRFGSLIGLS